MLSPEFASLQRAVAGRYSLVRELGRGGMGVVSLARDVALDRLVAIKLLPPSLAADRTARERFLREARMAASLTHPHIVPIHAVESSTEATFFVMAFVDGESLGERVRRRGSLPPAEVSRVMQEVSWALAHAHARGIVHRDIKPDNILLDRESGRAMVTDFGIAYAASASTPSSGVPAGTPHYLSPEVAAGQPADGRSDLYALGVTAWFALTGRHPFEARNTPHLLLRQSTEEAPALQSVAPSAPARLARAIDRALARMPDNRWPNAEALAIDLDAVRATARDVPAPVRAYVREVIPAGNDIGMGLTGVAATFGALGVIGLLENGSVASALTNFFVGFATISMSALFGGLALVRLGSVAMSTRDLVESGYGHESARRALLEADAERMAEARDVPLGDRRRRALTYGVVGTAKTALAIWLATVDRPDWVWLPATVLSVLIPVMTIRGVWNALRTGPGLWTRILRGGAGRALFRLASLFSGRRSRAAGLEASPTVHALGAEADALFKALPAAARDQLRELPAVLASLRDEAERLHRADQDTNAERVAVVVAAMESMRLELLALQAGQSSIPDVTALIERARQVSERVDDAVPRLAEAREPTPA